MSCPKGSKNKLNRKTLEKFVEANGGLGAVMGGTPYKLTLKSMGRVFQSEGATFEDAVDKIKISGGARSVSVIKVETGGKEITKILNARYTNGLFGQGSPTMKAIHLKGVKMVLGV